MQTKLASGIVAALGAALFYIVSFPLNTWLSATMPRHQIIQLPAMVILGVLLAMPMHRLQVKDTAWGIALLIYVMASLIFWMLPHSIDYAFVETWFNRLMHVNMVTVGLFITAVMRGIRFEVKILFIGMVASMLMATGVALRSFNILLCSSYSIDQQRETGMYVILIGVAVYILTVVTFGRMLRANRLRQTQ